MKCCVCILFFQGEYIDLTIGMTLGISTMAGLNILLVFQEFRALYDHIKSKNFLSM